MQSRIVKNIILITLNLNTGALKHGCLSSTCSLYTLMSVPHQPRDQIHDESRIIELINHNDEKAGGGGTDKVVPQ